jgi:hypothetical protein
MWSDIGALVEMFWSDRGTGEKVMTSHSQAHSRMLWSDRVKTVVARDRYSYKRIAIVTYHAYYGL